MKTSICFVCYGALTGGEKDFHRACSRKMFGENAVPVFEHSKEEIRQIAKKVIQSQVAVPGVQPKLSLDLKPVNEENGTKKLTIVGFMGEYILKPPSEKWEQLPELEDLTMHLAEIAKIKTVPHCLIRMKDDSLAYITRRIDRAGKEKFHMEDMCQLTERLTENKYDGGYEQVLRAIRKYSANPGLDSMNFFELLVFSFLTGNSDMHLKNFSLIDDPRRGYTLTPAYDLVPSAIIIPDDKEDMALHLNGKKNKISREDFEALFERANATPAQQNNIFGKMKRSAPKWMDCIKSSFIDDSYKERYINLIKDRGGRLGFW